VAAFDAFHVVGSGLWTLSEITLKVNNTYEFEFHFSVGVIMAEGMDGQPYQV
jgi:hypothetical protein